MCIGFSVCKNLYIKVNGVTVQLHSLSQHVSTPHMALPLGLWAVKQVGICGRGHYVSHLKPNLTNPGPAIQINAESYSALI